MTRSTVDLPVPEGPIIPTASPRLIFNDTPSNTFAPKLFSNVFKLDQNVIVFNIIIIIVTCTIICPALSCVCSSSLSSVVVVVVCCSL